jgi:hypothetical protein
MTKVRLIAPGVQTLRTDDQGLVTRTSAATCGAPRKKDPDIASLSRATAVVRFRRPILRTVAVEKKFELGLTGPVKHGVLITLNCRVQNPSAEMRGGFSR